MSQANLVLVQCLFDAWSQSDLKAFLSFVMQTRSSTTPRWIAYRGIYRGHEQIEASITT
jgi:hypothetical protein